MTPDRVRSTQPPWTLCAEASWVTASLHPGHGPAQAAPYLTHARPAMLAEQTGSARGECVQRIPAGAEATR
jgi:hypothetical protein